MKLQKAAIKYVSYMMNILLRNENADKARKYGIYRHLPIYVRISKLLNKF